MAERKKQSIPHSWGSDCDGKVSNQCNPLTKFVFIPGVTSTQ